MLKTPHGLDAWQIGILEDIGAAGVMTTDQLRRLRFPGTGKANCRSHLSRLRCSGLIERLEPRLVPVREACWRLTEAGAARIGLSLPMPPAGGRSLDSARVRQLLLAAEAYVGEQTALRLDQFGDADGDPEAKHPEVGGPHSAHIVRFGTPRPDLTCTRERT